MQDDAFNTFFSETGAGKHVPRSIFLDLEVKSFSHKSSECLEYAVKDCQGQADNTNVVFTIPSNQAVEGVEE